MSDIPFLFFAAWEIFMTIPHQLILDENNEPAFAVIPYPPISRKSDMDG